MFEIYRQFRNLCYINKKYNVLLAEIFIFRNSFEGALERSGNR